jgi:hypothetical protein
MLAGLGLVALESPRTSGQDATALASLRGHTNDVFSLAITADGKTLVSGSADKTIKLWDLATGKEQTTLKWRASGVYSLSIAADSKILAAGSFDGTIVLWDLATGKQLATLEGHSDDVSVALTADGRTLASGSLDKTEAVKIWDVATGKPRQTLQTEKVRTVAISGDGKTLAWATWNKTVTVWDVIKGREKARLHPTNDGVNSLAFSADGRELASFSPTEQKVKLWEVATCHERVAFEGRVRGVLSLALTADGRTLAAGRDNGTVKLWDASTGKEMTILRSDADVIHAVLFTPNGKTLAAAEGPDTTIRLWDVSTLTRAALLPPPGLAKKELDECWTDLASPDAARAFQAICALIASAPRTLPFLEEHLYPVLPAEPKRVGQLIADFDDERFATRERASEELAALGESVGPALRKAVVARPSPEALRRMEQLLSKLEEPATFPDLLRVLRAIEVLEQVGTADARRILKMLADGMSEARATEEAKQALNRLAKRDAVQGILEEKRP